MRKVWFVRYEPGAGLLEGIELSPLAELAHRRLVDLTWQRNESLLNSDRQLAVMARCPVRHWRAIKTELLRRGWKEKRTRFAYPPALRVLRAARQDMAQKVNAARARHAPPAPQVQRTCGAPASKDEEVPSTNSLALTVEARKAAGQRPGPKPGEAEFLRDVKAAVERAHGAEVAAVELRTWGGWWRNRFREDPEKALRVLADVRSMGLERRLRKTLGATAVDLWGRLP